MDISIVRSAPKPPNHRRLIVLGVCVAFYVGIIYLVQSGLGKMMVEQIMGSLETRLIEDMNIEHEAHAPPPPTFKGPPSVVIDMPAVTITEAAPTTTTITETAKPTVAAPPPVVKQDVVIAPKQDKRYPISTEEFYPSMSK